jgi:hypothetical protein
MGPRLIAFSALLARRYGPRAAAYFLAAAKSWLADPANEPKQRALEAQLIMWAGRVQGAAGRTAGRLALEVERRRGGAPLAAWERDVMGLRAALAEAPEGEARERALGAYCARVATGARLTHAVENPAAAGRRALDTLTLEERMLVQERIAPAERDAALEAVRRARAACYGAASTGEER